jgi:hypothetical protein
MTGTTNHTAKCLNCGRVRRFRSAAAAERAKPTGRICAARIRLAMLNEAVRGFASAQVEKARELISDGGLIPTGRPGVFRAVSSKGDGTYLVSAKGICGCPGGRQGTALNRCYHAIGARIVMAGKAA